MLYDVMKMDMFQILGVLPTLLTLNMVFAAILEMLISD